MRTGQFTLTSKDVQAHATQLIQKNLKLSDYSRKCTANVLLAIVFAAAARLSSIAAACQRLAEGPSDETLRKALLATLPDYAALQKAVNRALTGHLPRALRRNRQRLAIDLHLTPYYGEPFKDAKEIYRSQAKKGTNHFHAYATAYVVRHGQRYTVALTPVERGEDMKDVVQRLLKQAEDVFGDVESARTWMTTKQPGLGKAVPLDFAGTEIGAREVENLLGRIEYGVYS